MLSGFGPDDFLHLGSQLRGLEGLSQEVPFEIGTGVQFFPGKGRESRDEKDFDPRTVMADLIRQFLSRHARHLDIRDQ